MRRMLALFISILFIASCNKTEDVTIKNNIPPPDHTIDSSTISIYVNKAYINLLGREPSSSERATGLGILRQDNFSLANRQQFIGSLFSKSEYILNQYSVANNEYLRNLDSLEIEQELYLLNYFLTQPQYAPFYDMVNMEIARIDTLKMVLPGMISGTVNYKAMLSRMTNNYFYDQINMGSENFVVSTYQNFLFRYPTDAELANGILMVNGGTTNVFLKPGKSKQDYIHIFFETDDYYEGQVRFVFKKYLFREPSPAEISLYAGIYKSSGDYKELQKAVFTLNEYAGL